MRSSNVDFSLCLQLLKLQCEFGKNWRKSDFSSQKTQSLTPYCFFGGKFLFSLISLKLTLYLKEVKTKTAIQVSRSYHATKPRSKAPTFNIFSWILNSVPCFWPGSITLSQQSRRCCFFYFYFLCTCRSWSHCFRWCFTFSQFYVN